MNNPKTLLDGFLPFDSLPNKLKEIAQLCSKETMWLILAHYGGGHLLVPANPPTNHPLRILLGDKLTKQFCKTYAGELLQIPQATKARTAVRNALIREERAKGRSLFTLARQFSLSERQIMKVCKQGKESCPPNHHNSIR